MCGGVPVTGTPALPDFPGRDGQKDALFAAAGFLYGGRYGWQTALARRMRVDSRTVRRWLSGQDEMRPPDWELVKLMVRWKSEVGTPP